MKDDAARYLEHALRLALEAKGGVSPRPPVGAVLVRGGHVVGEGKTEPRPGVHAEVAAIRAADEAAHGATMYCTLEPHAHQGVAPPCTEEIIKAGISTVVCPIEDPNPQVNGNGFRQLRAAGVEVVTEVPRELRNQAEYIISGFKVLLDTGRPQVTLKYAMSLDGKIATASGESQWITGELARAEAHRLRHESDAVITGIGTVLADNPRMTARREDGSPTGRPRLRVVLDTQGRMPGNAALLAEPGHVLWVTGEDVHREAHGDNVEVTQLPVADGHVEIGQLVNMLGDRGVCDALVEAGGTLTGAFVTAGLVDRVTAFVGPIIIGGDDAPGPVGGGGPEKLSGTLRLKDVQHKRLGDDVLITGRVAR